MEKTMLSLEVDGLIMRDFKLVQDGATCGSVKPSTFGSDYSIHWDGLAASLQRKSRNISMFPEIQEVTMIFKVETGDEITATVRTGWGARPPEGIKFRFQ